MSAELLKHLHTILTLDDLELPAIYGDLSPKERYRARVQYERDQGGLCWHCKSDLNEDPPKTITRNPINWDLFPPGFLEMPIHLQHDHETGETEGAIHAYCNAYIWEYLGR